MTTWNKAITWTRLQYCCNIVYPVSTLQCIIAGLYCLWYQKILVLEASWRSIYYERKLIFHWQSIYFQHNRTQNLYTTSCLHKHKGFTHHVSWALIFLFLYFIFAGYQGTIIISSISIIFPSSTLYLLDFVTGKVWSLSVLTLLTTFILQLLNCQALMRILQLRKLLVYGTWFRTPFSERSIDLMTS